MKLTDRDKRALAIFAVFAACLAIYGPYLSSEFVYDDFAVAGDNAFIRDPANLPLLLTGDYYRVAEENTYRPVTTLTYFADYRIWGAAPLGFNFTGMLLHMLASVLVMMLVRRLVGGPWLVALTAGLVFAAHPICTEAVVSEGNREEGLSVVFFVGALLSYLRARRLGNNRALIDAAAVFAVGLFAMEMIVTLPAILLLVEWIDRREGEPFDSRAVFRRVAPFAVLAGLFLVGRFTIWTGTGDYTEFPGGSRWTALLTMTRVFFTYARLLLLPAWQHVVYDVDLSRSPADPRVIGAAIALAALLFAGLRLAWRRSVLGLAILWFFVILVPVSNLVVPFWVLASERYLYLALPSLALAVGWIGLRAQHLPATARSAVAALLLAACVVLGVSAHARAGVWATSRSLWADNVAKAPGALDSRYNLAIDYLRKGDLDEAQRHLEAAVSRHPDATDAWLRLADVFRARGQMDQAAAAVDAALAVAPENTEAMIRRAYLYARTGEYEPAIAWFNKALDADKTRAGAWAGYAAAQLESGDRGEALKAALAALELDPGEANALQVMAHLNVSIGDRAEAVRYYTEVIRYARDPALAAAAAANIRVLNGRVAP